jgi:hypothetical protein
MTPAGPFDAASCTSGRSVGARPWDTASPAMNWLDRAVTGAEPRILGSGSKAAPAHAGCSPADESVGPGSPDVGLDAAVGS